MVVVPSSPTKMTGAMMSGSPEMTSGWSSMRILEPTTSSPADPGPKSHV